jgi:uncharacterized membrane protein YidH (DUF202 family)
VNADAPGAPVYLVNSPTNGLAIASLVLSLVGVSFIGSILGIIFGHIARSQIRRTGERGAGLALAGLIIGYVTIGLLVTLLIIFVAVLGESLT